MSSHSAAWSLITRLGEAQILLPAMAAGLAWLSCRARTRPLALAWLLAGCTAALITTASKVAFIGWELGYAPLDYTGISGHSLFAALTLPVLARIAAGRAPRPWPRLALGAGYLLAALITVSRVLTGAHSTFEAVLGFVLGGVAAALALRLTPAPDAPTPGWLAAAVLAWLVLLPFDAPPSRTHQWVTQLSLRVSGRSVPYTRRAMHHQALRHGLSASGRASGRASGSPSSGASSTASSATAGVLSGRTHTLDGQHGADAQVQAEPVHKRQVARDGVG